MTNAEFTQNLAALGLKQNDAAALLRVTPRAVRRWQSGDQEVPGTVAALVKAWCQLHEARIPWSPDLESIWYGDDDQIRRQQDHALALTALLNRVAERGGPPAPWRVNLKERSATLGSTMAVRFYRLLNGGFSLASYRRSDLPPDPRRDQPFIEDAVAAFANSVGKAKAERPGREWDE